MTRRRVVAYAYYGVLGALLVLILTTLLPEIVPARWARRLSYNSEGYLFALALAAWIQCAIPGRRGRRPMQWAAGVGVFCAVVGIVLIVVDPPSRFRTLNESMFALALAIPYVTLRRPVHRWVPWVPVGLAAAVVIAIAVDRDSWAIAQAETIGFIVLIPIALDVVDRGILQADAPTSVVVRWSWYSVLVAEMLVVSMLGTSARQGDDLVAGILDYLGRIHESVIGVLLLQIYFAVGLGRRGLATDPRITGVETGRASVAG